MKTEIIIVYFVNKVVVRKKGAYIVQFAGVSNNPRKMMELQVWDMPFTNEKEAFDKLKDYTEMVKEGKGAGFLMVHDKKKSHA